MKKILILTVVVFMLLAACKTAELPDEPPAPGDGATGDIAGQAGRVSTARYQQFLGEDQHFLFSPPYDVLEGNNKLFELDKDYFKVSDDGIALEVNAGHSGGLVYKYGYVNIIQDGIPGWRRYELSGTPVLKADGTPSNWLNREGTASLSFTREEMESLFETGENYIVAYTCKKRGGRLGQWKCGCKDEACTTPYWMLQSFLVCRSEQGIGYFEATGKSACLDPCSADADCAEGSLCKQLGDEVVEAVQDQMFCVAPELEGVVEPAGCDANEDCAVGEFCREGGCNPFMIPQEGAPAQCAVATDCPIDNNEHAACVNNQCMQLNPDLVQALPHPHLYATNCNSNTDCGGIYSCIAFDGRTGCLQTAACSADADCREGAACGEDGSCTTTIPAQAINLTNYGGTTGRYILSFKANPTTINAGQNVMLGWDIIGADPTIEIRGTDNTHIIKQALLARGGTISGSVDLQPTQSVIYTLFAKKGDLVDRKDATVTVEGSPVPDTPVAEPTPEFLGGAAVPPALCSFDEECLNNDQYACVNAQCVSKDEYLATLPECADDTQCAAEETCRDTAAAGNRCIGQECISDANCEERGYPRETYRCAIGTCKQYVPCPPCKDGMVCNNGQCETPTQPMPCTYNVECSQEGYFACLNGQCVSRDGYRASLNKCTVDTECGVDEECRDVDPNVGYGYCAGKECSIDADCGHQNYRCYLGNCAQYDICNQNSDCQDGTTCNELGTCVEPPPVQAQPEAQPPSCVVSMGCKVEGYYACLNGICKTEKQYLEQALKPCNSDNDCLGLRVSSFCANTGVGKRCIGKECCDEAGCLPIRTCDSEGYTPTYKCFKGFCEQNGLCVNNFDCSHGTTCDPQNGKCT